MPMTWLIFKWKRGLAKCQKRSSLSQWICLLGYLKFSIIVIYLLAVHKFQMHTSDHIHLHIWNRSHMLLCVWAWSAKRIQSSSWTFWVGSVSTPCNSALCCLLTPVHLSHPNSFLLCISHSTATERLLKKTKKKTFLLCNAEFISFGESDNSTGPLTAGVDVPLQEWLQSLQTEMTS